MTPITKDTNMTTTRYVVHATNDPRPYPGQPSRGFGTEPEAHAWVDGRTDEYVVRPHAMTDADDLPHYVTEDGVDVIEGDRVYNYYDMVPGTIGRPAFDLTWFEFHPDEPGVSGGILNGQRICTMAFAKARGFRGA
jgi:hypothetical protein